MTNNDTIINAINDFKRSVEITRDVRFQANLRLARRQRGSTYLISTLSLYVIALSLIPNILNLHQYQNQLLLACSIVLSVFVIFTSLIDGAQNFYYHGELLHQCARKIATIHHDLKNINIEADPQKAAEEFARLQKEYGKALDDCPFNHDNTDFYAEKARKPHLFVNDYKGHYEAPLKVWFWSKACFLEYAWVIPHLIAFIAITVIVVEFVILAATFGNT